MPSALRRRRVSSAKLMSSVSAQALTKNNNNKYAVILDQIEEARYRGKDESNFFNFMTILIIISCILYNVRSTLSALSVFL